MARFDVHVVPGASKSGAYGWHGGLPRLRVRSAASEGRANAEAEALLSDLIAARVVLVRGAKSRRKTFDVGLDQQQIDDRLREAFGG